MGIVQVGESLWEVFANLAPVCPAVGRPTPHLLLVGGTASDLDS